MIPRLPLAGAALLALTLATTAHADTRGPWWDDAVFYQIFVRSFADASTGPLAGDGVGDLQGLVERLDYLNDGDPATTTDLGVDAIWLLPVNPSPSYHGYDVTDYFDINPDYGDLALFRRLVSEAHRRGIRVIIDLVVNHASARHPAFLAATADTPPADFRLPGSPEPVPPRDLFRFAPAPEQETGPWGQRVWHYHQGDYHYGVFDSAMPDWNFRHPSVTAHHQAVARFWLQDVGIDGFRLDAVRYLYEHGDNLQDLAETKRWLRNYAAYCRELRPGAFIVGEVWADTEQSASYAAGGGLDATFEFDLANAFLETAAFGTPSLVSRRLERTRAAYGDARFASFLANHDQERTRSRLGGDFAKNRLAALLQFTAPGIPFIYYGEEIGMLGRKPDPDLRTPFQWTAGPDAGFTTGTPWRAVNDDHREINVALQTEDPGSLLSLYRRLVRLRSASPALRDGRPVDGLVATGRGVYTDLRASDTDTVLVAVNTTASPRRLDITLPPSVAALGPAETLWPGAPDAPALGTTPGHTLGLPPQSAVVYRWPAAPAHP